MDTNKLIWYSYFGSIDGKREEMVCF